MIQIESERLQSFAANLLEAGGMPGDDARLVAVSLVGSNLRGYDSHGVMRIPSYVTMLNEATLRPGAELSVIRETETLIVSDGNWGVGQVQAMRLLDKLIAKADERGMAAGSMIHCGHIGRLGEYCERAAEAGLVSLLTVNSHGAVVRMAPPGGAAPRLSTNPLAFGVPNGDQPLVADFSTSATAEGKVRVKRIAGEQVPDGWLIDSSGSPTNDPNSLYADPPGSIRPMGGDQAYKGFALGLMVEILSGALSGGVTAREDKHPRNGNCVFMLVLNPAHFGGADHFASEVRQLLEYVRSCPTAPECESIVLPGDPERSMLAERLKAGLRFDEGNWTKLCELASELGVEVPGV